MVDEQYANILEDPNKEIEKDQIQNILDVYGDRIMSEKLNNFNTNFIKKLIENDSTISINKINKLYNDKFINNNKVCKNYIYKYIKNNLKLKYTQAKIRHPSLLSG
jgi:hypothetical protein